MFTLSSLDPLISDRSLLKHPFYQKWNKGELTLENLRVYAKEYYWLVQRIPGIVEKARNLIADPLIKMRIEQNVQEELSHIDLWIRFAKALKISEAELHDYEPSVQVKLAVRSLEELVSQGEEEAVAAIYALERELPKIAETKMDGLEKFYGLTSDDARAYFQEHLNEEKHFSVWMSVDVSEERARPAVEASMKAQNQILDAVCDRCGLFHNC